MAHLQFILCHVGTLIKGGRELERWPKGFVKSTHCARMGTRIQIPVTHVKARCAVSVSIRNHSAPTGRWEAATGEPMDA